MTTGMKTPQGRRAFARISKGDITKLCELQEITVQITTSDTTLPGTLVDVSEGGLAVELPVPLDLGLPIKILFTMGERRISCEGAARTFSRFRSASIICVCSHSSGVMIGGR